MKRILALALSLVMALTLCVPALAAAPERPGWVKDWEYTVFEADDVYTGETWQIVERLPVLAAAGVTTTGLPGISSPRRGTTGTRTGWLEKRRVRRRRCGSSWASSAYSTR